MRFHPGFRRGFSLVEILVVISIGMVMAVLSVPVLGAFRKSGGMNRAILNISLQLEQARAHAMANQTYVWIGFATDSAQQSLAVQSIAGLTGAVTDLDSSSTYAPLSRLENYDRLTLETISGIAGMASADDVSSSQIGSFTQTYAGKTITFNYVLQYSPTGEVTIKKTNGISRWIQIGLRPATGSSASEKNVAALQVGGLTGQVLVFRP